LASGTIQGLANHTVLISRDGRECDIADSCSPIRDRDATVVGAVLVFRDVTEEYVAQQALRDGAARVNAVLNTVVDGIVTFHADDNRVQSANPAVELMFGYGGVEVIGQSLSLLIPEFVQHQQEPHVMGIEHEVVGRRKDGSIFPLEMAISEMWLSGRRYFTGIFRDITERKEVEANQKVLDQRLRDQQFYTRSLIESNIDALITTDPGGVITDVNQQMEALTGCTRGELIGTPFKNYFSDPHRADAGIKRVLSDKKVSNYELTARARDGQETEVSYNASVIYDRERRLQGVFIAARDVTERKRLDQVLQEKNLELENARLVADKANLAKSEFLATMSHEIRTPMNGVIGMIDVLQQSNLNGPQLEMTNIIHDSAFALLEVINDILDFSKIEANKLEIEFIPLSVAEVVESACENMNHMASKKEVELTLFVDPAIPAEVLGDPGRLRQVLINLTNNAIKFSCGLARTGRVAVRVLLEARHEDRVMLEFRVIDNGIGIDEATRGRLFTAFVQADTSTTRHFGGTGLGLAISGQLVDIMGGKINVQSEPGKGSVFSMHIPFGLMTQETEQPQDQNLVAGLSCLVMRGPEGLANDIASYLSYDKAVVEQATELASARQWMDSHPPGVCIVIIDASVTDSLFDELRVAASARVEQTIHFVVIDRGLGHRLRGDWDVGEGELVQVDGNFLTRKALLKAVAVAAGRLHAPDLENSPVELKVASVPMSREEARLQGSLILVAEDNEYNQKVIWQQLMLLGRIADIANNGEDALKRWQSGAYAILITDLHMPLMDGYELTAAIRAAEDGKTRIPIIAFTANALKGEAEHCKAVGMDDYLSKPVQLAQLRAMLKKWQPIVHSEPIQKVDMAKVVDVQVLAALIGEDEATLREFLNDFRTSATQIAHDLRTACRAGDAAATGALAHKLKSSARSVGALALGDVCNAMEQAGKVGNAIELAVLLPQFELALASVDAFLLAY
jgi:PAS domain S-box-containing protein